MKLTTAYILAGLIAAVIAGPNPPQWVVVAGSVWAVAGIVWYFVDWGHDLYVPFTRKDKP